MLLCCDILACTVELHLCKIHRPWKNYNAERYVCKFYSSKFCLSKYPVRLWTMLSLVKQAQISKTPFSAHIARSSALQRTACKLTPSQCIKSSVSENTSRSTLRWAMWCYQSIGGVLLKPEFQVQRSCLRATLLAHLASYCFFTGFPTRHSVLHRRVTRRLCLRI